MLLLQAKNGQYNSTNMDVYKDIYMYVYKYMTLYVAFVQWVDKNTN